MSDAFQVALIGAGEIGRLRARAIARTGAMRLVAVADTRGPAAEALAGETDARASADPMATVVADDVDAVVVSTPPDHHEAIACRAMAAGKHVLVEKPLAHRLDAAQRMCAAAEAHGVCLATGFNHRFFLSMRFARRLVDDGRIGEVRSVRAFAGHPGGEEIAHAWIRDPAVTGGGALVDNGIHILDLTRYFVGEVMRAQGYVGDLLGTADAAAPPLAVAEDNGFALFRGEAGRIASAQASWTEWRGYRFYVEVVGREGYVRARYPPMLAEWGRAPGRGGRRRWKLFPRYQLQERLFGWQWTIIETFALELSAFAARIAGGPQEAAGATGATGLDGLRALEMAHAIYRSSREGVEVAL